MIAAAEARGAATADQPTSPCARAASAADTATYEAASSTSQPLLQLRSIGAAKSDIITAPVATVARAISPPPGSSSQVGVTPTFHYDRNLERMTEEGCSSPAKSNGRVQQDDEVTINTAHASPVPSPPVAVEAGGLSAPASVVDESGGISDTAVRSSPTSDAQGCPPSSSGSTGIHPPRRRGWGHCWDEVDTPAVSATSDVGGVERSSGTTAVNNTSSASAATPVAANIAHVSDVVEAIEAFDNVGGSIDGSSDRRLAVAAENLRRMREVLREERIRAVVEREEAVRNACMWAEIQVKLMKTALGSRERLTATLKSQLSGEMAKTVKHQAQVSRIEEEATEIVPEERLHSMELAIAKLREENAALTIERDELTADIDSMQVELALREEQRNDHAEVLASSDDAEDDGDKHDNEYVQRLRDQVGRLSTRLEDESRVQLEIQRKYTTHVEEFARQTTRQLWYITILEGELRTAMNSAKSKNAVVKELQKRLQERRVVVKELQDRLKAGRAPSRSRALAQNWSSEDSDATQSGCEELQRVN